MNKSRRNKNLLIHVLASFIAVLITLSLFAEYTCFAAASGEIISRDDFYDRVSEQFYTRELIQEYPLSNYSLGKDLVHMDWHSYSSHYNPKKPLKSGCYLIYYIDSITLTYSAKSLKALVSYRYSSVDMDMHFSKMNALAQELRGETDFETVRNVHDYLIKNYEYDSRAELGNHTDIEGFRDGVMVCTGYSMATYYLLNTMGISTRIIVGFGGSPEEAKIGTDENHMWNMVQVEGKWYNLDVTWDDAGGDKVSYDYFLKSDAEFSGHRRLGIYADSSFSAMVSQESYPLPPAMRSQVAKYWYIYAILIGVVILVVMQFRRRVRGEQEDSDGVPDWNPSDGMWASRNMGGYYPPNPSGTPYGAGQPLYRQSVVPQNSPYYAYRAERHQSGDDPYAPYDTAQQGQDPYAPYDAAHQGQDPYAPYDAAHQGRDPYSKYAGNPYAADPAGRDFSDPAMGSNIPAAKQSTYHSSEGNREDI